ncbi:MAG: Plasmid pRiA4b ORF-3-like protein [Deltaproteobacteria bacterium ADurb.Bin151]|nr:plasmid pRiA4b ORF-3 family protein [Smithella sp.]OQB53821.1 MAG: Plasmid pRiA4b ORF-3-like protein [Deltaproteobacteria bacterium ADurb.Bin151]
MKLRYEKNYTDRGYLLNYKKLPNIGYYKNRLLQFKIELNDISPLIWRRILVPPDYNFWDLHVAIQDAMGWFDYHLHHFEIKGKGKRKTESIGIPDFDRFEDSQEIYPGWEIPVLNYFNDLGIQARYIYDYGDSWTHTVTLEGYLIKERGVKYPVCIDGARACPPEDCGGDSGYYRLLDVLANPADLEYEDLKTWVGEGWDPEKFDKKAIVFDLPYKRWRKAFIG